MKSNLAKRLRTLRKEQKLSIRQVAERLQIPLTTYREWEYGRAIRGEPYPKLAEIFQVSLGELITGEKPTLELAEILASLEQIQESARLAKKQVQSLF